MIALLTSVLLLVVAVWLAVKPRRRPVPVVPAIVLACAILVAPIILWVRHEGYVEEEVLMAIVACGVCLVTEGVAVAVAYLKRPVDVSDGVAARS